MLHIFNTDKELFQELSSKIIADLKTAIELYGEARMLVSGGTSPQKLYQTLSNVNINWQKVKVGLCDERFVYINSEFSNEKLITENLCVNFAKEIELIGMVHDLHSQETNLKTLESKYELFEERTDVVVLGMGMDGHTASLFPNDPASDIAIKANSKKRVYNTLAPSMPKNRITCGYSLLSKGKNTYLLIPSKEKLKVLESAINNDLPISKFLNNKNIKLDVYTS